MRLETIRQNEGNVATAQAEVIATIRKIPDKNEVFGVLTRSNKMFNKNNVRFAASDGGISLNGINVDISKFGELSKTQQTTYLIELPTTPTPSAAQAKAINTVINKTFQLPYIQIFGQLLTIPQWNFATILNLFQPVVQEMLLKCLKKLLDNINGIDLKDIFGKILPDRDILETVLRVVIDFFKLKMISFEEDYVTRRAAERLSPDFDESDFANRFNASANVGNRALIFFERAVTTAFAGGDVQEGVLKEMLEYFMKWITEQIYIFEENRQIREQRGSERQLKNCTQCNGKYYFKS